VESFKNIYGGGVKMFLKISNIIILYKKVNVRYELITILFYFYYKYKFRVI
jgi:hypothetical protein